MLVWKTVLVFSKSARAAVAPTLPERSDEVAASVTSRDSLVTTDGTTRTTATLDNVTDVSTTNDSQLLDESALSDDESETAILS